jgi:hypothetical protein
VQFLCGDNAHDKLPPRLSHLPSGEEHFDVFSCMDAIKSLTIALREGEFLASQESMSLSEGEVPADTTPITPCDF